MTGTMEIETLIQGDLTVPRHRTRKTPRPSAENVELGRRLQELRKQKSISQNELAECAGLTQRAVSYYESGYIRMPAAVALKIADALQISIPELMGKKSGNGAPPPSRKIVRLLREVEKLPNKKQRRVIEYVEMIAKA